MAERLISAIRLPAWADVSGPAMRRLVSQETPSYELTGDTARDIALAMEAAFDWAERELP